MQGRLAVAAPLALAALVAACSNPWRGYAPTYEEIVGAGWIGPEVAYVPAPLYCYATLAEPDCYATPQRGETGRLVGHYGPPVR